MKGNDDRSLARILVAGLGILFVAAIWAASAGGQYRQMPTPKPQTGPQTAQPIPGGPANPYLVEIGTLKQQVAALQQGQKALEADNTLLKQKVARTEQVLAQFRNQQIEHTHGIGYGLTFHAKEQYYKCCPPKIQCSKPLP